MRIGIDASRAFDQQKTGTESYSYELITRILKLPEAKKHTWILYVKPNFQFSIFNFQSNSNFQFSIINLPKFWTQIGLAFKTWTDKLDVLWVPAHTLPVFARPGLARVVTIHGIEYEWLPAYENLLQRWYLPLSTKYACWAASKIIAVSRFTKSQLIERLGADPKKISVIYEGTNYIEPKRSTKIRERYILFIGTVQPRKNLVRLIEALPVGVKLIIAGKLGWNYQEVLDAAKNKNVEITGFVSEEERNKLLKNALCYVQPSITEGFGLPILEAMAAGVPVISSNGGALPEIVGDAGLLFDPYDQDDISHKLSLVIHSHSLRTDLIIKGHLRTKDFSWEKAARKTYKILTNI